MIEFSLIDDEQAVDDGNGCNCKRNLANTSYLTHLLYLFSIVMVLHATDRQVGITVSLSRYQVGAGLIDSWRLYLNFRLSSSGGWTTRGSVNWETNRAKPIPLEKWINCCCSTFFRFTLVSDLCSILMTLVEGIFWCSWHLSGYSAIPRAVVPERVSIGGCHVRFYSKFHGFLHREWSTRCGNRRLGGPQRDHQRLRRSQFKSQSWLLVLFELDRTSTQKNWLL